MSRKRQKLNVNFKDRRTGEIALISSSDLVARETGRDCGDPQGRIDAQKRITDRQKRLADQVESGARKLGLVHKRTGLPYSLYALQNPDFGGNAIIGICTAIEHKKPDDGLYRNVNISPEVAKANRARQKNELRLFVSWKTLDNYRFLHGVASFRWSAHPRASATRLTKVMRKTVLPAFCSMAKERFPTCDMTAVMSNVEVKYQGRSRKRDLAVYHVHCHFLAMHRWVHDKAAWTDFLKEFQEWLADWSSRYSDEPLYFHVLTVKKDIVDEVVKYLTDDLGDEEKTGIAANDDDPLNDPFDDDGGDVDKTARIRDTDIALLAQQMEGAHAFKAYKVLMQFRRQFQPKDIEVVRPDGSTVIKKIGRKHIQVIHRDDGSTEFYCREGVRVERSGGGTKENTVIAELGPKARGEERYAEPSVYVVNRDETETAEQVLIRWETETCQPGKCDLTRSIYNGRADGKKAPILRPEIEAYAMWRDGGTPDMVPRMAPCTVPHGSSGAYTWGAETYGPADYHEWAKMFGAKWLSRDVLNQLSLCKIEYFSDGRPYLVDQKTARLEARRRERADADKEAHIHDKCPPLGASVGTGQGPPRHAKPPDLERAA